MTRFKIRQSGPLFGQLTLPGDKSLSHRAVILGSIARGTTRVTGLLRGEDVTRTIQAFQACGVAIEYQDHDWLVIEGAGLDGLSQPAAAIDLGNSGTSIRLLTGLFAGQGFETVFKGDESLSTRPMRRVVDPLREMGAQISLTSDGTPPVHIHPVSRLQSIDWQLPIASAQVKSAILLAALYAHGQTRISEPIATRDYTETMLARFGASVRRDGIDIQIEGKPKLKGQHIEIPADFSSAAFFIVAALLVHGSELLLKDVGVNTTRTGLLSALAAMGASISFENQRQIGAEPVADLRIVSTGMLQGIEVPANLVPFMIDEIPILAIAAALANGRTVLTGCDELRVKESDRIHSVVAGLKALGVNVTEHTDGMSIEGGSLRGGQVDSFGDHRIAMAFAVAGAVCDSEIEILNCDCVNTSFPEFVEVAQACGIVIEAFEVIDND